MTFVLGAPGLSHWAPHDISYPATHDGERDYHRLALASPPVTRLPRARALGDGEQAQGLAARSDRRVCGRAATGLPGGGDTGGREDDVRAVAGLVPAAQPHGAAGHPGRPVRASEDAVG